jgi:hypothetical protein
VTVVAFNFRWLLPSRRAALNCVLIAGAVLLGTAQAPAQVATRVSSDAPIVNFRLPTFTDEGFRAWLVRGSEARMISTREIDVRELTLTVFTGDAQERIETMILSPVARVFPEQQTVAGLETIRVIDDRFEATGADWRYEHQEKRVFINRNVRVTFRAQLKDLLQ